MITVSQLQGILTNYPPDAIVDGGPITISSVRKDRIALVAVEPLSDGVWSSDADFVVDEFSTIRFRADRDLSQGELDVVTGCIAYAARQHLRGERLGDPERVGHREWECFYDITKSRSDDWLAHLDDFIVSAQLYARLGTPERRDGTRLIEGVGQVKLDFLFL